MAWLAGFLSTALSMGIATSTANAGVVPDGALQGTLRPPASLDADGPYKRSTAPPPPEWRVAQAVQLAAPPSPPAKPPHVFFADHFSGAALSNDWEIINGNPEHYVIDSGDLLIVARSVGGLGNDKSENIFRLKKPLPDGNWVITVKLNVEIQTMRENFTFGVMDDSQTYLAARLHSIPGGCCAPNRLGLDAIKVAGNQTTEFDVSVALPAAAAQPISVRLKKDGYAYRAGINFTGQVDNGGNPAWVETGAVTSLHPPHIFALNAAQWEVTTGETPFRVISVSIEQDAK
jgi:hypothetical protein